MKNQLAHISHMIGKFKKGTHTQRYITAERIAAMKENRAHKNFDLSCYQQDWFLCFAHKDANIWMAEGFFNHSESGAQVDVYSLPYSVQNWMLIDCVLKNFEYRKNNTPKPPKHRKSGMINYLNKQQYGTRW